MKNKIKITVEAFEKFEEVKNKGGNIENYKEAGLSIDEIEVIVYGYNFLKSLYENGMLGDNEITAELAKEDKSDQSEG